MKPLQFILKVLAILLFVTDNKAEIIKPKNYGPYNVVWHKVDPCPSFRVSDMIMSTKFVKENDEVLLHVNYTTNEAIEVDTIKMKMLNNEKERRVLWTYIMEKPCKHITLGPYLIKLFRNNQCILPKENRYVVVTMDISPVIGDNFFYGTYLLRASLHAKKKNISCVVISFSVVKKPRFL